MNVPVWPSWLLGWPEPCISATFHRWLPGDENRSLPMPLRYAATHPQSPQAIVHVLAGAR